MKTVNSIFNLLKNEYRKIIITICCIVSAFIVVYAYTKSASYSVLTLDDFIHYSISIKGILESAGGDLIKAAMEYAKWDCHNCGGRYFSMFMQVILGPLPFQDFLAKERMVMVCINYLYFISIVFFIYSFVSNMLLKYKPVIDKILYTSVFSSLTIIILHALTYNYEIFNWFSGMMSYSLPMACLFISLGFLLYTITTKNVITEVLSIIFGFFALGGNISVVVLAFIFVFPMFLYCIRNKKLSIPSFTVFLQFLVFALINILAPGNIIRRETEYKTVGAVEEMDFKFTETLTMLFKTFNEGIERLFGNNFFWIFLIIFSLIVVLFLKDVLVNKKEMLLLGLWFIFAPLILILIFSVRSEFVSVPYDRCCFMIDFIIILSLFIVLIIVFYYAFCIVAYLLKKVNFKEESLIVYFVIIILLFSFLFDTKKEKDFSHIAVLTIVDDINTLKYEDYYNAYEKAIKKLDENRDKEYVLLEVPSDDDCPKYLNKFYPGGPPYMLTPETYIGGFFNIKKIDAKVIKKDKKKQ